MCFRKVEIDGVAATYFSSCFFFITTELRLAEVNLSRVCKICNDMYCFETLQ